MEEMVRRNRAIEMLKSDIDVLEKEKSELAAKVTSLEAVNKILEQSEAVAIEKKNKAIETCGNLRDELDAERKNSEVFKTEADDLRKELDRAKTAPVRLRRPMCVTCKNLVVGPLLSPLASVLLDISSGSKTTYKSSLLLFEVCRTLVLRLLLHTFAGY